MKKFKKSFLLRTIISIAILSPIQPLFSMEVGNYDGGEYCYRIPKIKSDSLYSSSVDDPTVIDYTNFPAPDMNLQEIRNLFPILTTLVHDHPVIYLDSSSTAQMPHMVINEIVAYYETYKSNVGRGLYAFAELATQNFENTRLKVARFIGAKKQEIIFTSGATAGINLVAHIWAKHHINKDDEIIISEVEHNANFLPWQQLAQQKGIILKRVPVNERGVIDIETFKTYLSNKTKLVAISHQSNILGTTNDIAALISQAHTVGAKVLVDAAQSIAHQKINVEQLDCDFLVFSGHKLFGPTGVGVLYIKENLFDQCILQNFGGGMVYSVTPEHTEFKQFPHCLEPGTQPIAQVIGLGAAIDFVQKNINFEIAAQHETALVRRLAQELAQIPGITLLSPIPADDEHNNMVTFTSDNYHAYDIAEYLNQYGIAVRAGFHCVQPYHDKLGGKSSVRVSFSVYNTQEEVELLITYLKKLLLTA